MPSHQHPPKNWQASPALSLTEAAAVLGVSRSRAYELAQAGGLATYADHQGRRRVKPRDLEPLLAQAEAQPDLFVGADRPGRAEPQMSTARPEAQQAAVTAQEPRRVGTRPTADYLAARAALGHQRGGDR